MSQSLVTWELWYPDAANTGLPFARARTDPADVLWVHAAPPTLSVVLRQGDERVLARGEALRRTGERRPMTRLTVAGGTIRREDRWPTNADLGALVILPGGEVGTLKAWWHSPAGDEWRWQVEFYNHQ